MGPAGNARVGKVVHPRGAGAAVAAPLQPGKQPVHLLLGGRGTRRLVSGVASGEVRGRASAGPQPAPGLSPGRGVSTLDSWGPGGMACQRALLQTCGSAAPGTL